MDSEVSDNVNSEVNVKIDITVSLNGTHETNKANETINVTTDVKANETINVTTDVKSNEAINVTTDVKSNEAINEDKEFPNKRELYDYYGIDINTIPDGYEVKMRYIKVKGKRGRLYKLAKK